MTSSNKVWGELIRCGGSEDPAKVPSIIPLTENPTFFGRMVKPQIPNPSSDHHFTHESQYVIGCLFVSSTHFSLEYTTNADNARVYIIRDYSRNGTFLDGVLVGKEAKTLIDGLEISLKYKDTVKIAYRFSIHAASSTHSSPQKPIVAPETNKITETLNRQIAMLQEQLKKLEDKYANQTTEMNAAKEELEQAQRTIRNHEKTIKALQHEASEAKERFAVAESHCSALQARVQVLESKVEDEEQQHNHWKSKAHAYTEELKEKSSRIDELQSSMNQTNQIVTTEHQSRVTAESQVQELNAIIILKTNQIQDLTKGNHALQRLLDDRDKSFEELQGKVDLYKTMLIAMQERLHEQGDKINATKHTLQQLPAILNTLAEQTSSSRRYVDLILGEMNEFQQSIDAMPNSTRPTTANSSTLQLAAKQLQFTTHGNMMEETAAEVGDRSNTLGRSQQELENAANQIAFTQVPFTCPPIQEEAGHDVRSQQSERSRRHDHTQAPLTMGSDTFALNQEQMREREHDPPLLSQDSHIRRASNTSPTKSSKNSTTTKASTNLMAQQSSQDNNKSDEAADGLLRLVGDKRPRHDNDDPNRTELPETNANDDMDEGEEDPDKTRIESDEVSSPTAKRLKFSPQQRPRSQQPSTAVAPHGFTSPRSDNSFYAAQDDEDGNGSRSADLLDEDERQRTIGEQSSASFMMDDLK